MKKFITLFSTIVLFLMCSANLNAQNKVQTEYNEKPNNLAKLELERVDEMVSLTREQRFKMYTFLYDGYNEIYETRKKDKLAAMKAETSFNGKKEELILEVLDPEQREVYLASKK